MTEPLIRTQARARLDSLAKPPGSLGRLEDLAVELCAAAGSLSPSTTPRTLVVFAADHGSVASGVSLWPQAVSRAVAATVLAGKAGCSTLAAVTGTSVRVVDAGLATAPLPASAILTVDRIRDGSRDMAHEPALTPGEFEAALQLGRRVAAEEVVGGADLLIAGEIGIGNTTAAAAITALLCGLEAEEAIGMGAGANAATLVAKRNVIAAGLARARGLDDPHARIAAVTGFEIVAMAGFYLGAAEVGVPVVLDGAISGAAALIAQALQPAVTQGMIAAHLSPEPAHAVALAKLGLTPFLDWGLRLGEGTGALALLPQLDMAVALMREMATLDEALAIAG